MERMRLFVPVLALALAIVLVPACGADESEKTAPAAGTSSPGETEPETRTGPSWQLDAESLDGYVACIEDLGKKAPDVLSDIGTDAASWASKADDLDFGERAVSVLADHKITEGQFKSFTTRLFTAVVALGLDEGGKALLGDEKDEGGGLGALAGAVVAAGVKEAAGIDLEGIDEVTPEDKSFVKKNLAKIMDAIED